MSHLISAAAARQWPRNSWELGERIGRSGVGVYSIANDEMIPPRPNAYLGMRISRRCTLRNSLEVIGKGSAHGLPASEGARSSAHVWPAPARRQREPGRSQGSAGPQVRRRDDGLQRRVVGEPARSREQGRAVSRESRAHRDSDRGVRVNGMPTAGKVGGC